MLQVKMPEAYKIDMLDVPVPAIKANEVLINMKRLGICGSDIQVYHGKHKYMRFPVVQGHEGAGVIVKTGEKAEGLSVGDKVTIQPQVFCGKCYPCQIGHYNVCEHLKVFGIHEPGMASEYFAAEASKVIKLPQDMSFDQGAMVEPAAVAVGAVRRCGDIEGNNILVLGAGTIGNLAAQTAQACGADKVMITDINSKRLDIAGDCGIEYCINTKEKDIGDAISEIFEDRKADVIIDCAGVKTTIDQAINNARRASKIVVVGNFKEPVEIEMPLLQRREIDMIGIMMYVKEDFEEAIRLMQEGKVKTEKLITDYYRIRDFKQAYEYIDHHMEDVMKVMLTFEG